MYDGTIVDHLKSINENFRQNENAEAFKKIKGITILNPDKRDGSIFNGYIDEAGDI